MPPYSSVTTAAGASDPRKRPGADDANTSAGATSVESSANVDCESIGEMLP